MTARRSLFGLLASLPFMPPAPVRWPIVRRAAADMRWEAGFTDLPAIEGKPMTMQVSISAPDMERAFVNVLREHGLIPANPDDRPAPWGWDDLSNVR